MSILKWTEKIGQIIERMREKHKLTYMDDTTYHEKWSFSVSTLTILSVIIFYTLLIIVTVMILFRYTSLITMVSTQSTDETRLMLEQQNKTIDSLYQMTNNNDIFLRDIKHILNDEPFDDSLYLQTQDTTYVNYKPDFSRSAEDSLFREKMENQKSVPTGNPGGFAVDFFFAPVNGQISQSFNASKDHYGIDVVTVADEPVKACLDGTVVVATWVPGEGNILIVQHNNDFISVYKHCSVLLKTQGDRILTGDPLGIVGNTGENTSGPHLHFELWHKGVALNPQEYISF